MKKTFYLFTPSQLKRQDNSLVILTKQRKNYLPILQIETLVIMGHVLMDDNVIRLLSKYHIVVIYLSFHGNYLGAFVPHHPSQGDVLISQVKAFLDEPHRLFLAKSIIHGSVLHMRLMLRYYAKRVASIKPFVTFIEQEIIKLTSINSLSELLLFEARIKKNYYEGLNQIDQGFFHLGERSVHPPKNAMNACLSFGYALLYSKVTSQLFQTSLTPSIGYIHDNSGPHTPFTYDLADLYKPILVDRFILRLIHRHQLTPAHFESHKEGVFLTKEGKLLFIEQWEGFLNESVHILPHRTMSFHTYIKQDLHQVIKHLVHQKPYQPLQMEEL